MDSLSLPFKFPKIIVPRFIGLRNIKIIIPRFIGLRNIKRVIPRFVGLQNIKRVIPQFIGLRNIKSVFSRLVGLRKVKKKTSFPGLPDYGRSLKFYFLNSVIPVCLVERCH